MSTIDNDHAFGESQPVTVQPLAEWTADQIADRNDPTLCDLYGVSQVLRCAVALRFGYRYFAACGRCAEALRDGLNAAMPKGAKR